MRTKFVVLTVLFALCALFMPVVEARSGPAINAAGQMQPGYWVDSGPPQIIVTAYDHDQDGWADSATVEIDGAYYETEFASGCYSGFDLMDDYLRLEFDAVPFSNAGHYVTGYERGYATWD